MTRRHLIAVAVALAAVVVALAQPLWISSTGNDVALDLQPVDPLSLFRGNYVDLRYDVSVEVTPDLKWSDSVYVVFDDGRPANALRSSAQRPTLFPGETCIRGMVRRDGQVDFPDLEQFFVTPEEGLRLERNLNDMVGIVRTTGSCRAILTAIEPR